MKVKSLNITKKEIIGAIILALICSAIILGVFYLVDKLTILRGGL